MEYVALPPSSTRNLATVAPTASEIESRLGIAVITGVSDTGAGCDAHTMTPDAGVISVGLLHTALQEETR